MILCEHDAVTLKTAMPLLGLRIEDRGTVVHIYADGQACEVEFVTSSGPKVVTLRLDQIRAAK